ncbi:hypothetical protein [Paraburkholderia dipogonis]|uniref:hypothetical protein n=1 Tax=Paraburkholderia dipogonis TaxID=1211383 RepID=UPI0038BC9508
MLVIEGFEKAAADLPFAMLGLESDNDSVFMNQSLLDYCKGRGLVQTRSRAYRKNDQAWVEQKNGAVVRRLVGYGRLSGVGAFSNDSTWQKVKLIVAHSLRPQCRLRTQSSLLKADEDRCVRFSAYG